MCENVYCYILHYYADWLSGRSKINLSKYICLNSRAAVKSVSETCLDDSIKEEAKDALYGHTSNCSILYSDFMHCMMNNEERVRVASIIH